MDIRKGVVVSRTNLIDTKKEFSIPWKGVGVITFLTLALWAGAFAYDTTVRKKVVNLESNVNRIKQGRDYKKIAQVADMEDRLNSIDKILRQRVDWEELLRKIEENTLPEITYSNMETKVVSQNPQGMSPSGTTDAGEEKYQMILKGTAIGLSTLSKQIATFENSKDSNGKKFANEVIIQKIDMKKTDTGEVDKGGALDFTIQVNINPLSVKNDFKNKNE